VSTIRIVLPTLDGAPRPDAAPHSGQSDPPAESPFAAEEVLGTLEPLARATMLPGRAYADPRVFAFEQAAWLSRDWVCVGRTSDVGDPGSWFVTSVGQASVVVVRDADRIVRAFHNVCRHRGALLLEGRGVDCLKIRCPYHAWSYDLAGRLTHAPGTQDLVAFDPEANGLLPVLLETFGGFVFVNLAPDARPLLAWLDDLPAQFEGIPVESLVVGTRAESVVRANWKLLMENFAESYHFASVHPSLEQKTPSRHAESLVSRGPWQGGWMPLGPGVQTVSLDGKQHGRPLLRKEGVHAAGVLDYVVWPNLFLSLQPDYLLAYRLTPLAENATRVTFEVLLDPASGADGRFDAPVDALFDAPDVYDFWRLTNAQDFAVCERQQLGVASPGYVPGRYTAAEEGVHEFDKIAAERYADP
jgi:Rieske 2Fe-2S family protein